MRRLSLNSIATQRFNLLKLRSFSLASLFVILALCAVLSIVVKLVRERVPIPNTTLVAWSSSVSRPTSSGKGFITYAMAVEGLKPDKPPWIVVFKRGKSETANIGEDQQIPFPFRRRDTRFVPGRTLLYVIDGDEEPRLFVLSEADQEQYFAKANDKSIDGWDEYDQFWRSVLKKGYLRKGEKKKEQKSNAPVTPDDETP